MARTYVSVCDKTRSLTLPLSRTYLLPLSISPSSRTPSTGAHKSAWSACAARASLPLPPSFTHTLTRPLFLSSILASPQSPPLPSASRSPSGSASFSLFRPHPPRAPSFSSDHCPARLGRVRWRSYRSPARASSSHPRSFLFLPVGRPPPIHPLPSVTLSHFPPLSLANGVHPFRPRPRRCTSTTTTIPSRAYTIGIFLVAPPILPYRYRVFLRTRSGAPTRPLSPRGDKARPCHARMFLRLEFYFRVRRFAVYTRFIVPIPSPTGSRI